MIETIPVPDVLPNNLRIIRDMRGLSVKDVANDLKVDRNFLSAVEMETKNFSGKTTIRFMKYYGISFYKMYDVAEVRECPVTKSILRELKYTLEFDLDKPEDEINDDYLDLRFGEETLKDKIIEVANREGINGDVEHFIIDSREVINGKLFINVETDFLESIAEHVIFDINFMANENHELADMLRFRGFTDTISLLEEEIDGKIVRFDDKEMEIVLDKEYKIPLSNSTSDYKLTNKLPISGDNVNVHYNSKKKPIKVKFKAITKEINCLKAIRVLLNKSIEEMHQSLGLSYNGYVNLELGNQKISTKIMWRLVQLLRVPLEIIVNVDEYYERYCKHNKKIRKPRKS